MNRPTMIGVGVVMAVIGGIAFYRTGHVITNAEHGSEIVQSSYPRGPHRGRLFTEGDFQFEVTIYETGVEPQFRFFAYRDGKPVPPSELNAKATVMRLGAVQTIQFKPEADYLLGDEVVYEPHSFDVTVDVTHAGKTYQWQYSSYEGRVQMAAASLQSGEIEIATAGPQTIASTVQLPGEVKIKHDRRVMITPRVAGIVVATPKSLGDHVKQGEALLVLESRDVATLRSTYLTSVEQLTLAKTTHQREHELWQQKITAEQDYLQAQKSLREAEIALKSAAQSLQAIGLSIDELNSAGKNALNRFTVRAPFSGVLISRNVALGSNVSGDSVVFELANIKEMEVKVAVYAQHLDSIKTGQKVGVKAIGSEQFALGRISFISTQIGENSRAAIAHVEFPNLDGRWREGQFVETSIVLDETTVPVAVKTEAIQTFRDWQVVFAQFGEQYEIRPVELGRSDGEWIEIVEGIPAGQHYVAHNSFVMKAELGKAGATHDH